MCEPEGEVLIDGVNSAELGLHTLRRSISVIPQESLLFSATLKVNMDPFEEFTDEQLWSCLEQVSLESKVSPDWICAVTSRFTKLFYCERLNIAHI